MVSLKKVIVHIGAHKTGTTHFQDTLALMKGDIQKKLGVHYIDRRSFRATLDKLIPWGKRKLIYKFLPDFLRFYLIKQALPKDIESPILFISEENVLGSAIDQCASTPYIDLERRMDFVRVLSKYVEVEVYVSIRSFDRVLPGAFVTGLRFFPERAINAKKSVELSLAENNYPTWHHLISRIKKVVPNVPLKIWTQEDYRKNFDDIIRYVLGDNKLNIPMIEAPSETVTPGAKGVEIAIETSKSRTSQSMHEWATICDQIYLENKSGSNNDKFNFLSEKHIEELKKSYQSDLININKSWPNSIITFQ